MSKVKPKTTVTQKVTDNNTQPEKSIYEQIWTTQQAINTAIAEKRVVRFLTDKPNKQIKKEINDLKDCLLRKPDKESNEVAVIPPGIEDFCFDKKVDTSIKSSIDRVSPIIYKPDGSIYTKEN